MEKWFRHFVRGIKGRYVGDEERVEVEPSFILAVESILDV